MWKLSGGVWVQNCSVRSSITPNCCRLIPELPLQGGCRGCAHDAPLFASPLKYRLFVLLSLDSLTEEEIIVPPFLLLCSFPDRNCNRCRKNVHHLIYGVSWLKRASEIYFPIVVFAIPAGFKPSHRRLKDAECYQVMLGSTIKPSSGFQYVPG